MDGLMTDVEPMGHLGSLALCRTTGLPTGPQQIVRLPCLDIHILQVSRKTSTTPRYFTDVERRKVTPRKWFKVIRQFPFSYEYDLRFLGIN